MRIITTAVLAVLAIASAASAEVKTKAVPYNHGDAALEGYLAWDDSLEGPRPAVLVVHEWWGLNDYAKKRTEQLAEMGYVAFALDMYGKGKVTQHPQEAQEWSGLIRANVEQWQKRAQAGLNVLRAQPQVDKSRIAAIGYCFGGATALQLAYVGEDLDGVVTFHGALPTPSEAQAKNIKASILICHGAVDPVVSEESASALRGALESANVDYQMVYYGGARHSFTNPGADAVGIEALKYDEKTDQRSWRLMQSFFDHALSE